VLGAGDDRRQRNWQRNWTHSRRAAICQQQGLANYAGIQRAAGLSDEEVAAAGGSLDAATGGRQPVEKSGSRACGCGAAAPASACPKN